MSRTPFDGLEHFARVVMERLNADGGERVELDVSTRARDWNGSPPRIVWRPSRDRFTGAQKVARSHNGRSLITRMAGATIDVWGAASAAGVDPAVTDIGGTEALVARLCRALVLTGGPMPFLDMQGGAWVEAPGQTALGDAYTLTIAVAIDVPNLTVPTVRPTRAVLVRPHGTPGDGDVDAGET
ncbi:MAG: hypothetical protein Q8S73_42985 [Deltaproteobacteria bacterium]|nr:hypothetical protein [Myxococcales bacterium]MDP3220928.1 hypothetical protein [Deltaproteobacteria bacterium]